MAAVILIGNLVLKLDASTGPIPHNCNRACLENVVDPLHVPWLHPAFQHSGNGGVPHRRGQDPQGRDGRTWRHVSTKLSLGRPQRKLVRFSTDRGLNETWQTQSEEAPISGCSDRFRQDAQQCLIELC
jgi:hypothetical protein